MIAVLKGLNVIKIISWTSCRGYNGFKGFNGYMEVKALMVETLFNLRKYMKWPYWDFSERIGRMTFNLEIFYLKGVDEKTLHLNVCFAHISASVLWVFRILVPTLVHDIPLIMWGRHKISNNPMYRSWDMSKTNIQKWGFFINILYSQICSSKWFN